MSEQSENLDHKEEVKCMCHSYASIRWGYSDTVRFIYAHGEKYPCVYANLIIGECPVSSRYASAVLEAM